MDTCQVEGKGRVCHRWYRQANARRAKTAISLTFDYTLITQITQITQRDAIDPALQPLRCRINADLLSLQRTQAACTSLPARALQIYALCSQERFEGGVNCAAQATMETKLLLAVLLIGALLSVDGESIWIDMDRQHEAALHMRVP